MITSARDHEERSGGHPGHPTSTWIVQQLREAFPYDSAPRASLNLIVEPGL